MNGKFPLVGAHTERFCAIAREYVERADGKAENLVIKRDHSLRVLDNAFCLVQELERSDHLNQTVLLAALYHDLGRFPQLEKYGTMDDSKSEDHGRLSVQALLRDRLLDEIDSADRKTIIGAIYLHNKKEVPSGLPEDMDFALRVVRDSDKLDIYKVMLENLGEAACRDNPAVVLGLQYDETAYTPEIVEAVREGELADYRAMRWVNDFKLLLLTWVYDLNFPASRRLLAERKMAHAVGDLLPDVPELQDIRRKVLGDLERSL
ncbi:MAG: HD domain-containing protein [Desulfovibrio sp.]|uniref:HD domain-containing protein n=1 Tax=Desulfovibrio sp. 7SRBS1 TaxID=3378064 RepID=UPI003B3CBBA0